VTHEPSLKLALQEYQKDPDNAVKRAAYLEQGKNIVFFISGKYGLQDSRDDIFQDCWMELLGAGLRYEFRPPDKLFWYLYRHLSHVFQDKKFTSKYKRPEDVSKYGDEKYSDTSFEDRDLMENIYKTGELFIGRRHPELVSYIQPWIDYLLLGFPNPRKVHNTIRKRNLIEVAARFAIWKYRGGGFNAYTIFSQPTSRIV